MVFFSFYQYTYSNLRAILRHIAVKFDCLALRSKLSHQSTKGHGYIVLAVDADQEFTDFVDPSA